MPHAKKHPLSFLLIFLGYGTGVVFDNILKPLLFKDIIDALASGLSKEAILDQVFYLLAIVCMVVLIHNIGYRVGDYAAAYFQSRVMKRLQDFTFEILLQHSYHFFANNFSGSIIAKAKRFTKSFETVSDIINFQIFFAIVTLSGILIVLFSKIPFLAYVFLGWTFLYILLTLLFIRKKISYDTKEAAADSITTGRLSDAILNVLNIKIFSSDKKEAELFDVVTGSEERKRRQAWYFGNFQNASQALSMGLLQVVVLFINIHFWYLGKISLGMFVLIQTYMFNLFDILWNLGRSLTKAVKAMTDMQEVVDIFDTPLDILDPKNPASLKINRGHVVFADVSFAYKDGNPVFQKFNLDIKPGERVGLVGHSGTGKSTITKLLLRFADVKEGSITIDGQDIRDVTQNDLRSIISYVPQESVLFHRSIRENIAYGKPNASETEITKAARESFAHDFIRKLTKGYDTLVGERGIKLSGGERQRISLARAMLKNAPIIVFDEATSSLDSVSEAYIQKGFDELMKNKTTIVVAHRLSTISKMDRIVVLHGGNIVEVGTHQELIDKQGVYAELWRHQSGGFLED